MATRTPVPQPAWANEAPFKTADSIRTELQTPWGSETAAGYFQTVIAGFIEAHPEAAADLRYVLNQAKWSVGWKAAGRIMEEELA